MKIWFGIILLISSVNLTGLNVSALAQDSQERPQFQPPPPPVVSPEVSVKGEVTFRIRAKSATTVQLESSDIPGIPFGRGLAMARGDEGVWSTTVEPLPPGAYRYNFGVDQVRVLDPVNIATSESNSNVWSLVTVPGSEWFDTKNVPHGAVAQVHYFSSTLKRMRRMLVYTPPGYESGKGDFPVFYLLHGAMDSDESWSTVGRAGFILEVLDNDELKKGLELVWFATGKDDFLIETSRKTVKMLQAHGFTVNYKESNGGHTWLNWRDYLCEFAPLLFQ